MKRKVRIAIAGAVSIVVIGVGGIAVAGAATGDDSESPITGTALERASRAALEHTGEGRVTGTETGDEESYYEVEVTLDNGNQVDVQLDANFQFVDATADVEDDSNDIGED